MAAILSAGMAVFLSTPSARRATRWRAWQTSYLCYFYPRPPRGGRLGFAAGAAWGSNFYPRPPRGGRRAPQSTHFTVVYFYPRPPRGGRRGVHRRPVRFRHISIHALREEGDRCFACCGYIIAYFYPRPPRGGRLGPQLLSGHLPDFYPRPPRGGRRLPAGATGKIRRISIHALREEGDRYGSSFKPAFVRFLSTPSARRATTEVGVHALAKGISIHALREEGDTPDAAFRSPVPVFLSTPSARRATSTRAS